MYDITVMRSRTQSLNCGVPKRHRTAVPQLSNMFVLLKNGGRISVNISKGRIILHRLKRSECYEWYSSQLRSYLTPIHRSI
ncbi:unnamed protein product [Phytomonas sp. Hart1]|nr:unnamed protein product [Phytomonas sp. Hart1]|eukprot:CCW71838.1 unnamed protein product [Phytomonas sp. isolate Hart1]